MTPKLTHFAINTDDVEATQAFYAAVFGNPVLAMQYDTTTE